MKLITLIGAVLTLAACNSDWDKRSYGAWSDYRSLKSEVDRDCAQGLVTKLECDDAHSMIIDLYQETLEFYGVP
jgi:hypothetical protein